MRSTITAISSPPRVDPPLSSSGKSHASAGSVSDASWSLTQWPSAAPAAAFLEDGTDDAWINVALAAENHDDDNGGTSGGAEDECLGGDDQGQKFQEEAHWMSFQRAIQSFAAQRQEAVVTRHTTGSSSNSRKKKNSPGAGSLFGNRPPSQHATKSNNSDSSNAPAKEDCVKSVIQETASISIQDSLSTANQQESKDQRLN
jgi:hypothetical protein